MHLYRLLQKREGKGKPLLAALIRAGKFGSMFLSQARRTKARPRRSLLWQTYPRNERGNHLPERVGPLSSTL